MKLAARLAPAIRNLSVRRFGSENPGNKPYFLGNKLGRNRKWEEWELPMYLFGGGGMALCTVGIMYAPNTDILDWGKDEAEARMAAQERGETIVYGKQHQVKPLKSS